MPEKRTRQRAQKARRAGKSASTAAGEFVREEIHHVRKGKHGARSSKQAVAIGLSKARRAGVPLGAPKKGRTSEATRRSASRELRRGRTSRKRKPSAKRSRGITRALRRERRRAGSSQSLRRQTRTAARKRTRRERSGAAKKAARTRRRKR